MLRSLMILAIIATPFFTACDDMYDCANADCSGAVCGDGVIDGDEECDDGNLDEGDGCDAYCLLEDTE